MVAPNAEDTAMEKLLVLYPTQPNPDAFKAYYVQNHIPLVRKLTGLLAFRYSFDVQSLAGDAPFSVPSKVSLPTTGRCVPQWNPRMVVR